MRNRAVNTFARDHESSCARNYCLEPLLSHRRVRMRIRRAKIGESHLASGTGLEPISLWMRSRKSASSSSELTRIENQPPHVEHNQRRLGMVSSTLGQAQLQRVLRNNNAPICCCDVRTCTTYHLMRCLLLQALLIQSTNLIAVKHELGKNENIYFYNIM